MLGIKEVVVSFFIQFDYLKSIRYHLIIFFLYIIHSISINLNTKQIKLRANLSCRYQNINSILQLIHNYFKHTQRLNMLNTNKKFFDKKNIIKNHDSSNFFKLTTSKNDHLKMESIEENGFKERQGAYSIPYEAEDEYEELVNKFQDGQFDVGYQVFQKAFPYQKKTNIIRDFSSIQPPSSFYCPQVEFTPINEQRQKMFFCNNNDTYEMNSECIIYFERESTQQQQEDFDPEQQSTKENSNQLKNDEEEF